MYCSVENQNQDVIKMGFLDKKDSQWDRVNRNVDNETGFLNRISRNAEQGEKKRFSFFGRGGRRE